MMIAYKLLGCCRVDTLDAGISRIEELAGGTVVLASVAPTLALTEIEGEGALGAQAASQKLRRRSISPASR